MPLVGGKSVNPIPTRGANYAHHITACPPGFENLMVSLNSFYFFENLRFVEGCGDQYNELKWENIWASMKEEPFEYDTVYTL